LEQFVADHVTSVFLLTVFFEKINGVIVSIPDEESEEDDVSCCVFGSHSILDALTNITSNNAIKVTMDVILPQIIVLEDIENIMIVGQKKCFHKL